MKTRLFTIGLVQLLLAADAPQQEAQRDAEKIRGIWRAVSVIDSGRQQPDSIVRKMNWVISENDITMTPRFEGVTNWSYKLDPTRKPGWIDLMAKEVRNEKQRVILGLYALEGNRLTICIAEDGDRPTRPQKLQSDTEPPDDMLIVFERQRPE